MAGTAITIETKTNGSVVAQYATSSVSDLNTLTRGERASVTLEFNEAGEDLVVTGSVTIPAGETAGYDEVIINPGGELTVNGTLTTNELTNNGTLNNNGTINILEGSITGFDTLLQYDEYAGKYSLLEMLDSTQKYRENFTDSTVGTLLLGIEPTSDLQSEHIPGVWALIDDIVDERNNPLTTNRVSLDVTVLAQYDEYADHAAVENDLQI